MINGKKVKLVEPKMISGNYFDLKLNLREYPELSMYEGIHWQTIDPKKQRVVAKSFPEKMKIQGKPVIRILNRIGESDSFKIRISGSASSVDIIFQPVFEVNEYCLAKNIYNRLLLSSSGENTEEVLKELNREKAEILVKRSFQIDGFGIWNCDRIYLIPNARTITAKLVRADNEEPIQSTFYLANKKVNSVFTYYSNRDNNLTYNPDSENVLWTVLENGKIAVYKFQDIDNYSKGKTETIKMRVVEQEIDSQEDVKKILNAI